MLPDFRVRQRDYLLELSRSLTEELDLEKLLARALRFAIEMLAGQAGIIALKEDGWRVAAAQGIAAQFLSYLTPLLAEENVRELNVTELNRMLKELTYTASMGLLNGTALPLAAHGQVIGVIFIFRNYQDLFTPNDRVILQSFADQAAIAVYNARLYGQVSYEKQRLDALLDSAADGIIILNFYGIQRDARFFDNPNEFRPERFSPENEKLIPKYAYTPFGGGPRVCIGNQFAMMEARLIVATIAPRFHLSLAPGHVVKPEQVFTLHAKYGMRMVATQRERVLAY